MCMGKLSIAMPASVVMFACTSFDGDASKYYLISRTEIIAKNDLELADSNDYETLGMCGAHLR